MVAMAVIAGSPFSDLIHPPQLGHHPRRLHENGVRCSRLQPSHRDRTTPSSNTPHVRNSRNSNDEAARAPVPRQTGRPCGWSASSVSAVVHRPLYRGEIVYNRTQKRDQWGEKRQRSRPQEDVVRIHKEELRIVSDELWHAAHGRLEGSRAAYLRGTQGDTHGRPVTGTDSKYLLTGMASCAECGGGLYVRSRSHGKLRAFFYGCATYHNRGTSVCTNHHEVPMITTDQAVLESLEQYVLHPDVVESAVTEAMRDVS